ncbi:unnamed protein product [Peronospora belbahrii]|uniref:Uncharacterized protein n=1 Tax=Peronospora belbahrii TaxID=622444 RepID=A0AAU9KTF4_9STRA|nr:unnamed protein product [Peronospora belbahrii]
MSMVSAVGKGRAWLQTCELSGSTVNDGKFLVDEISSESVFCVLGSDELPRVTIFVQEAGKLEIYCFSMEGERHVANRVFHSPEVQEEEWLSSVDSQFSVMGGGQQVFLKNLPIQGAIPAFMGKKMSKSSVKSL